MRKTPTAQPTLFAPDPEPPKPPTKRAPCRRAESVPAIKPTSTAKSPRSKAIPVHPIAASPQPVKVITERSGAAGRAWRMSGKHAVAYLRNAVLAGEILATDPRHLAKAAMAVYYDRKGKAFAWQVRFDAERWDEVVARLE